jgi:branched-chain amino acid transport system substrate-binding protein
MQMISRPRLTRYAPVWVFLAVLSLVAAACNSSDGGSSDDGSSGDVVKIALIMPFTGPFGEFGENELNGAQFAVDEINREGGIESLDGAKLELVQADAGDSVERATVATQRVLDQEDVSAILCCALSSFTVATSQISERAQVPTITDAFADTVTQRGLKFVFRAIATSSQQVNLAVPLVVEAAASVGAEVKSVALLGDNTEQTVLLFEALRAAIPNAEAEVGLDQTWTPPLTNSTQLALQVKDDNPDLIVISATATDDAIALIRALDGADVDTPILGNGAQYMTPQFLEGLGDDVVNGRIMAVAGSALVPGSEEIVSAFEEEHDGFMLQDNMGAYSQVWILKEALEAAGSSDPVDVRDALAGLELEDSPATAFIPDGKLDFNDSGENVYARPLIQQWQESVPVTIAPVESAQTDPQWPTD